MLRFSTACLYASRFVISSSSSNFCFVTNVRYQFDKLINVIFLFPFCFDFGLNFNFSFSFNVLILNFNFGFSFTFDFYFVQFWYLDSVQSCYFPTTKESVVWHYIVCVIKKKFWASNNNARCTFSFAWTFHRGNKRFQCNTLLYLHSTVGQSDCKNWKKGYQFWVKNPSKNMRLI